MGKPPPRSRPRTASRVAAVQALFQSAHTGDTGEPVVDQFVRHRVGALPGTGGFHLDEASWQDHDVLEAEHAAFVASCVDGAPVLVDALAGRRALEAAIAVSDSMARSRAIAEASGLI